jgi:membrane associated rhomboid family serine protease
MADAQPDPSDRSQDPGRPVQPPMFNIPAVVVVLAGVILAVQLLMSWSLNSGNSIHAIALWLGAVRTGATADQFPPAPLFGLTPFVLHAFVHFGWMHTLVNLGALVAFGSAAARPFGASFRGAVGFLGFYGACAISGAVLSSLMHWGEPSLMVGASTAVSGLVPAAGWAYGGPRMMWRLALPWLGMNGALALAEPFFQHSIAWEGHVGGILMGMAAYPLFLALSRGRLMRR